MLKNTHSNCSRISVVIPLYNKADTIVETLGTVFAQTQVPEEVIVVNDGSSDNGVDLIIKNFGNKVVILNQLNMGVSSARNKGVRESSSEYIAFLDADDLWSPHYLEEVQRLISRYPDSGLIGTRYQYIDSGGRYVNPKIKFGPLKSCLKNNRYQGCVLSSYFSIVSNGDLPFNASTVTMKKSLLVYLKGFPEGESMGEDQDLWARAALNTSIAYSPRVLGFYNRAADNRACNSLPPSEECPFSKRLYGYSKNFGDTQLSDDIVDYTAAHLCFLAAQNIKSGQYVIAKKLLSEPRCARQWIKRTRLSCLLISMQVIHSVRLFVDQNTNLNILNRVLDRFSRVSLR